MAPKSAVADRSDLLANPEMFGNDIPTYRAVSALALTSAAAGLISGLSFVAWGWLGLAVVAVAAGVAADFRIRKMPDVLTGRSFAHAGIAMGLIFGVTSTAYGMWSLHALKSAAMKYAQNFTESLNEAGMTRPINTSEPLWYMIPPGMAKEVSPEEAKIKMAEMLKNSAKAQGIEEMMKQMIRYAGPGNPISVLEAEKISIQDSEVLVSVLVKVGDGRPRSKKLTDEIPVPDHDHEGDHDHETAKPADPNAPPERISEIMGEGPDHALVLVHGTDSGRQIRWFVDQIRYPYVPKSFTPVAKKKAVEGDDGHGHGH